MLETALTAFTTFFAVIGPIDTAVLLASLTPNMSRAERRAIAFKAVFIATVIVLAFALFGGPVLGQLGVVARRASDRRRHHPVRHRPGDDARQAPDSFCAVGQGERGGREQGRAPRRDRRISARDPTARGTGRHDIAIVLAAGTKGDLKLLGAVIAAILAVMAVTLMLLLAAQEIHQLIGITARKVIVRVFGVLLAALAVQSIFNGLAATHLFH